MNIDMDKFRQIANNRFSFTRNIRFLDAKFRIDMGDLSYLLTINDDQIQKWEKASPETSADFWISAPKETWEKTLQKIPEPFYHGILGMNAHHGLEMSNDNLARAYYPMLEDVILIMREVVNGGVK